MDADLLIGGTEDCVGQICKMTCAVHFRTFASGVHKTQGGARCKQVNLTFELQNLKLIKLATVFVFFQYVSKVGVNRHNFVPSRVLLLWTEDCFFAVTDQCDSK